jgi:hypothetical protein
MDTLDDGDREAMDDRRNKPNKAALPLVLALVRTVERNKRSRDYVYGGNDGQLWQVTVKRAAD